MQQYEPNPLIKKIFTRLYHKPPKYFFDHLRAQRLRAKSRPVFRQYLRGGGLKKLQIGCGYNPLKGWLNTDLNFRKNEVAYLDAGKKFPLPDASFDYIYSEHIFEHLTFSRGLSMLQECYRILKPGGHLRLATPDFDFLVALYREPEKEIHKKYIQWSTNRFIPEVAGTLEKDEYRASLVVNNFFRDWDHQVIYNLDSLKLMFEKSGFSNVCRKEVGSSEIEEFNKLEKHGEIIPADFNALETLVVEATKSA